MHFLRSVAVVLTARLASAQLPNIPQCALQCFVTALTQDGCPQLTDFACHCQKPQLVGTITPCVQQNCPDINQQASVSNVVVSQCSAAGHPISVPPVLTTSHPAPTTSASAPSSSGPAPTTPVTTPSPSPSPSKSTPIPTVAPHPSSPAGMPTPMPPHPSSVPGTSAAGGAGGGVGGGGGTGGAGGATGTAAGGVGTGTGAPGASGTSAGGPVFSGEAVAWENNLVGAVVAAAVAVYAL